MAETFSTFHCGSSELHLHICGAALSSRFHVPSQRASVQSDESPSSGPDPGCCSANCTGFIFLFVGAEENGGDFGFHAERACGHGLRPARHHGQAVKGRKLVFRSVFFCIVKEKEENHWTWTTTGRFLLLQNVTIWSFSRRLHPKWCVEEELRQCNNESCSIFFWLTGSSRRGDDLKSF